MFFFVLQTNPKTKEEADKRIATLRGDLASLKAQRKHYKETYKKNNPSYESNLSNYDSDIAAHEAEIARLQGLKSSLPKSLDDGKSSSSTRSKSSSTRSESYSEPDGYDAEREREMEREREEEREREREEERQREALNKEVRENVKQYKDALLRKYPVDEATGDDDLPEWLSELKKESKRLKDEVREYADDEKRSRIAEGCKEVADDLFDRVSKKIKDLAVKNYRKSLKSQYPIDRISDATMATFLFGLWAEICKQEEECNECKEEGANIAYSISTECKKYAVEYAYEVCVKCRQQNNKLFNTPEILEVVNKIKRIYLSQTDTDTDNNMSNKVNESNYMDVQFIDTDIDYNIEILAQLIPVVESLSHKNINEFKAAKAKFDSGLMLCQMMDMNNPKLAFLQAKSQEWDKKVSNDLKFIGKIFFGIIGFLLLLLAIVSILGL